MNLPSELTFLKQKAKEEGIIFDKTADESTISYEIAEKMKDKDTPGCKKSLKILEKERLRILNDAMHNPKDLSRWLYENQGEMRFGSENRIFVVLVDTKKFEDSWKLKRNLNILKPEISAYVKRLKKSNIQSMRVDFAYKGKPGIYSALTDVLFVLKK
jgi:hypothetical protein